MQARARLKWKKELDIVAHFVIALFELADKELEERCLARACPHHHPYQCRTSRAQCVADIATETRLRSCA